MLETLQRLKGASGIATVLSMLACYGTLALVAVLATLGIVVQVNGIVWVSAIIFFAALATLSLFLSQRNHGQRAPLVLGIAGLSALAYAFFIHYNWAIELGSFIALVSAAVLDRRTRRFIASERND